MKRYSPSAGSIAASRLAAKLRTTLLSPDSLAIRRASQSVAERRLRVGRETALTDEESSRRVAPFSDAVELLRAAGLTRSSVAEKTGSAKTMTLRSAGFRIAVRRPIAASAEAEGTTITSCLAIRGV